MAVMSPQFHLCVVILIIAALSSFTIFDGVSCEDSSKSSKSSGEQTSEEDFRNDRKKRSQEEILFGNQQNKPSGLVDDIMGMAEDDSEIPELPIALPLKKSNDSDANHIEDEKPDDKSTDTNDGKSEEKRNAENDQTHDMMMGSGANNWYSSAPVSSNTMQYLADSPPINLLKSNDFANSLYDNEDLERRKRELWKQHSNLKKRSLRSSLGSMIRKRGVRLPRRSMRLKRQVDVEQLLNLFGNSGDRYYDQDSQVAPHIFGGRAQTVANKRRVPVHIGGPFSDTPSPYPYVFRHRDDDILSSGSDVDDALGDDSGEDMDHLMLFPPNTRYIETPEYSPFRSRDEDNEMIQEWLARHTTPNIFSVSRRSSPVFYPIDYRFVTPGLKKRSSFRSEPNMVFPTSQEDQHEGESDLGKWGRVVAVPEAYASPEDVARLYGLANLMAEGDEPQIRRRSP